MPSETALHRHQLVGFCSGNGLDLGSAGDPIVPTAIQVEKFDNYCPFFENQYPPQLRGDATNLVWFKDGVLDFVYSSHLIEDYNFSEQHAAIVEWVRVLKPGGYLVILAPEYERWHTALKRGQPPNLAHKREPSVGDFTLIAKQIGGLEIVEDRLCNAEDPNDYSMMFVAKKL